MNVTEPLENIRKSANIIYRYYTFGFACENDTLLFEIERRLIQNGFCLSWDLDKLRLEKIIFWSKPVNVIFQQDQIHLKYISNTVDWFQIKKIKFPSFSNHILDLKLIHSFLNDDSLDS